MTFVLTDKAMQSRKLPRERGSNRTHLENTSGQRFTIIQWRRVWQLFSFYQLASDARRGTGTARRNNHTNTRVTTAAHCTSTGIHDKTHQEPTTHRSQSVTCWGCQWINKDNWKMPMTTTTKAIQLTNNTAPFLQFTMQHEDTMLYADTYSTLNWMPVSFWV